MIAWINFCRRLTLEVNHFFFVKFDHAGIFDLEIFCIEFWVLSQTSYRLKFKHFEVCLDCSWLTDMTRVKINGAPSSLFRDGCTGQSWNSLLRFRWKEHLFNRPEQPIFYLERVLSFVVLLTSAWYYFLHSTNLLRNSTDLRQIDRNFLSIVLDQCESVVSMNRHFEGYVYDHLSIWLCLNSLACFES